MYSQISANKRNTFLLIAGSLLILNAIGIWYSLYSGDWVLYLSLSVAVTIVGIFQYFMATRQLISLTHAYLADDNQYRELHRIVENLAITAGIPKPKIYIIPDSTLNAFATGTTPEKAIVGVTEGLLEALDREELEGVIGHEIAHIKNYDIKISTAIFAFSIAILFIGEMLLRSRGNKNPLPIIGIIVLVVGYPIVYLMRLAVSRQREYLADATSVQLTRYPDGLANALKKIGSSSNQKVIEPSAAHMFFNNKRPWFFASLFSTHPPIESRISRISRSLDSF